MPNDSTLHLDRLLAVQLRVEADLIEELKEVGASEIVVLLIFALAKISPFAP